MLASSGPVLAAASPQTDRLTTYVAARAADAGGNPREAARLLAGLARELPAEAAIRQRAISQAIEGGDMALALSLSRGIGIEQSPLDLRMLLVADQLKRRRDKEALATLATKGGTIDASFMQPFVEAWVRAGRRDPKAAESLDIVARGSALANQVNEHRALIYLKLRRPADALPYAKLSVGGAGGRADRLRLAFAEGFRAAGDKASAAQMLEGQGVSLAVGRAALAANKSLGQAIDTPAEAFGELLLGLALGLGRMDDKSLPIALAQVAHYANPESGATKLLLALLLDDAKRPDSALELLRTVDRGDPFAAPAEDAEARILSSTGRRDAALARAQAIVAQRPSADAYARVGSVLSQMKRNREAAEAFAKAIELSATGASSDEQWALRMFRAAALEEDNRWAEAKTELELAMRQSPDNALLLNFLGYGKLERGEDLDSAEAMVRQASALKPDDASITDSLGWAEFKRGKVDEAIATLERAANGDPDQSEIREHLGDALYTAGRRIEARFAWRAALVTVEEAEAKARLESKLERGLTKANAAP